ncbi:MAG: hypothetical protein CMJ18_04655 [Phycisphaeraceae bacterium]|nr:hypothetical protein [Phycisphaeraceae bacterium]
MYGNGDLWFQVERLTEPVRFAYASDFHLPPMSENVPARYQPAIQWWAREMGDPNTALGPVLDEITRFDVDFVFFGGDILDCFDLVTARHVREQCKQRGLRNWFQFGNHDIESWVMRFETHQFDADVRREKAEALFAIWDMTGSDYAFTIKGVGFISLDCPYHKITDGQWAGVLGADQVDWLERQIQGEDPVVVFHHVPLSLPTFEHRMRAIWNGKLATLKDDAATQRFRDLVADAPQVLGTFAGHTHMRSEDPIGCNWQFVTGAGHERQWRLVCISPEAAPKSMRVPGEPAVTD